MNRSRFGLIAILALIAIVAALYLSSKREMQSDDTQSALLMPFLAPELDTVTELSVLRGSPTPAVTVHRNGDVWSVTQRDDYPADVAKVHKLLLAISDAKIIEEKTSDPAKYSILGVDDPTQPGASGAEVSFTAKDGKHAVIVGKPTGDGTFVRRGGENKSFSVAPAILLDADPHAWIDAHLLNIRTNTIQSVELKPATGAGYVLRREKSSEPSPEKPAAPNPAAPNPARANPLGPKAGEVHEEKFTLEPVPAGRKALDGKALAPSGTALLNLTAEDVAKAGDIDFSKPSQAIFTMSNGDVLTVIGTAVGDKRWIELQGVKDPALAAKTQNRAFEIETYRYDAIFRTLDELLVPKETKTAPGKPESANPPAGGRSVPAIRPGAAFKVPTQAAPAPAQ